MAMKIGKRIKELRILNGLTQEELASRTELSKGFISQIERDLTSPSISTLEDILQSLGVSVAHFFSYSEEEQVVFSEEEYFEKIDEEFFNTVEWVIPNAQKNQMEPIRLTLSAGGKSPVDKPHEGEEFGYILQGTVEIHLGGRTFKAKKGESFYYKADKSHFISSSKGAVVIWVATPPTF